MYRTTALAVAVALALLIVPQSSYAMSRMEFHDAMRKLWEDHVTWTRLYIVSAVSGLPDQNATAQRLLQNQTDIGNAMAEFYGREAGDRLTALLKDHILIAADLVAAAKAGDGAKVTAANARWHQNARDIASFLHAANPEHWPLETMQSSMNMHLQQTLDEATHRLKGDYAAEASDYEHVVEHILMMADVLSNGIMAQFPSKFSMSMKAH